MSAGAEPFPYEGDEALKPLVVRALRRVIDPEMALDIVGLGLVYGVRVADGRADVRITMTSAACPVIEMIVADLEYELGEALGPGVQVHVEVTWDPPWVPERMTNGARAAMGWD
ncbi:MAG TPA: metal-sulfur cluster assembly factor [Usitatibacter sp.]|nr:metal-sulfur cluster assembly factor [Usitatibacter sp.]